MYHSSSRRGLLGPNLFPSQVMAFSKANQAGRHLRSSSESPSMASGDMKLGVPTWCSYWGPSIMVLRQRIHANPQGPTAGPGGGAR